jgi:hypothetical protein
MNNQHKHRNAFGIGYVAAVVSALVFIVIVWLLSTMPVKADDINNFHAMLERTYNRSEENPNLAIRIYVRGKTESFVGGGRVIEVGYDFVCIASFETLCVQISEITYITFYQAGER